MSRLQSRNWVFTLNMDDEDMFEINVPLEECSQLQFAVYQLECVSHYHYQGYLEMKVQVGRCFLRKLLPGAHFEVRRGSQQEAIDYCVKQESRVDGPFFIGTKKNRSGQRKDYDEIHEAIWKERKTVEEVASTYSASLRMMNGIREHVILANITMPEKSRYELSDFVPDPADLSKPCVFCGPSGIGKTEFALAHFKCPLLVSHVDDMKSLKFPKLHDGIVFDDFSVSHWPPQSRIHLVDAMARTIHARYVNVHKPAKVPMIFTINNYEDLFGIYPPTELGEDKRSVSLEVKRAIERRIRVYRFRDCMYNGEVYE